MTEDGIYNVLAKINDSGIIATVGDWVMIPCPFAETRHIKGYDDTGTNFGVHIDDEGPSRYNCLSCKSTGSLSGLFFQVATLRDDPDLREYGKKLEQDEILGGNLEFGEWEQRRKVKKGPEVKLTNFPSEYEFHRRYPSVFTEYRAIQYLQRRGISVSTAFAEGLRYDPANFRILFPIYDEFTGRFAGCSGRSIRSAKWRADREMATGKKEPKIRDYFKLQKDRLLLGSSRHRHGRGLLVGGGCQRNSVEQNGPIIAIEGLFAYARIRQIRPKLCARALLGSKLTAGKAHIFRMVNRPIYWLTDDDLAGATCLYGTVDAATGEHNPDRDPAKYGALDILYGDVAQFTMEYPEGKTDPDQLTGEELDWMIENASLYIR